MKVLRRLTTFIAAFLVMFTMGAVSALAAGEGTIKITPPTGVDPDATNTYMIYKVFDGVGDGEGKSGSMSYTLVEGKTTAPAGFTVDAAGNVKYTGTSTDGKLTEDDIKAIAAYVANDKPVTTATSKGSAVAIAGGLTDGYYFITTSTGTVVTIDSANHNAAVQDKNTVPTLDKEITGADEMSEDGKKALAQVGHEVEYTVTITVGKGSKNLVFHDTMDAGLTFKGNDKVTVSGVEAKDYKIKETPDAGDTITIEFADGIAANTEITIKYVAIVNASALTKLENDAYLTYGDNYSTEHKHAEVYNATIKVIKMDGQGTDDETDDTPLEGAGFVLKNSEGKFYHLTTAEDGKLTASWEASIADADEHVSDKNGNVPAFEGLSNGTYTLVEKTVPVGFNKAADVDVTISGGDFNFTDENSLVKLTYTEKIFNNRGSLLPTTGGMGTTLFYLVGSVLIVAGVAYFILRRKVDAE